MGGGRQWRGGQGRWVEDGRWVGDTSTFNTLQEQLYSYSTENNNNDCDDGSQMSSLLEPVLVVLDNLVDAVFTLLVQLC